MLRVEKLKKVFRSGDSDLVLFENLSFAVGISFVATMYPSWSAARILPAEALRYE